MALYVLMFYSCILVILASKLPNKHSRRLLDTTDLNCSNSTFEYLDDHQQFLCVNRTVGIWNIAFHFEEYQCLTESEIDTALNKLIGDSAEDGASIEQIQHLRGIGSQTELALNGDAPIGIIAWILLKEVFGFNATLRTFYEDVIPIVHYFEPPHVHLEIYPSDMAAFGTSFAASLPDGITGSPDGLQSNSNWAIQREVRDAILNDLNKTQSVDIDLVFLEWWKTYTSDTIIDVMSHASYIDVPLGDRQLDDYEEPCEWDMDSCLADTNTWFPDACFNDSCATLFQFLPGYNDDEDRNIIEDNDMRLKITYFGGEWTNQSKKFWADKLKNETRSLWSIWSPTTWSAGGEFVTIGYPHDTKLGEGERAYKLIPTKLAYRSTFAYDFLLNLIMTNDEYDWINKRIWDKEGMFDTFETELEESCIWIKYQINSTRNTWLSWIPSDLSRYMFSCSSYADESLRRLYDISISPDVEDEDYVEFIDSITAQQVLDECLTEAEGYLGVNSRASAALLGAQIISTIGIVIQTVFIIITIYHRQSMLMKTSSVNIMLVMLFGGYLGFGFSFLADAQYSYIVFMRMIFNQSALILMLTSLTGKTWRLQTIKANALKGNTTKLEDKHIFIRISVFYVSIICVVIVMQLVFPPVLQHEVFDHILYVIYRMDDRVKIFQTLLWVLEIFCFIYVGSLGWKLRDINKKYNESKHIAIILYNTTMFILLILLFSELSLSPYAQFAAESLFWSSLVIIDTAVLLLPKCYHLYRGTVFLETGLNKQVEMTEDQKYIKIDKRTPSRKDIKTMRDILKQVGYMVAKKDEAGHIKEVSTTNTKLSTND